MQKIIDGKRYDTATATAICDVSGRGGTMSQSDFGHEHTWLYRTPKGRFFIQGRGGARSRWAQPYGSNGMQGGEGLRPIDETEARALCERFGTPQEFVAAFGEPEEA